MKISKSWLHELTDLDIPVDELAHQLTMAGLEVGSINTAAPEFSGVVIGKVTACDAHPDAEKLCVCQVNTGDGELAEIVCGAPNVRAGLTVAVAKVGARLPGKIKIRKAKLRGVTSMGMICSARELGLGDEHDGIMELPDELEVGQDFREAMDLDDHIIELELTPNRGDCLGLHGVAREAAALNGNTFTAPRAPAIPAMNKDSIAVHLDNPEQCSRYVGRVIRSINGSAQTPLYMKERLRRAGLRAIHPVVDITNYVMLESGKPMHGFDYATMQGDVRVRAAKAGEKITLLDERELELNPDILVIADDSGARALAGIMGGHDSGVSEKTRDVFFESAFFDPIQIAGKARRFGMHTDASHRFERGVDPDLCVDSIERATALLLEICGGEPGPVVVAENADYLPGSNTIELSQSHLHRLVGRDYDKSEVSAIFARLGLSSTETSDGWRVNTPGYRFDLAIPEDLIEEVVRIHGYDQVEPAGATARLHLGAETETKVSLKKIRSTLIARGYQEAITYSFVDPALHRVLCPGQVAIELANPISTDLSVMRSSLLPGLLDAVRKNRSRQKKRVRFFETGLRFIKQDDDIIQENVIGVIASGPVLPEQWQTKDSDTSFFDMKGDLEAVLGLGGSGKEISFVSAKHEVFHPGQTAEIYINQQCAGVIGALHPRLASELELDCDVLYAELNIEQAFSAQIPQFRPISRYPEIRRDLAFQVDEAVTVDQILAAVRDAAPDYLKDLRLFDIYRGKAVEAGTKSIALGLILQDSSRTLTDVDADEAIVAVSRNLKQNLHAKIRD